MTGIVLSPNHDIGPVGTPDCVGPVLLDAALMTAVHDVAADTGTDVLAVLSVCAAELTRRLSRPGQTGRARMIIGRREAVTHPVGNAEAAVGLRIALARAQRYRVQAIPRTELTLPADVTLLIGDDEQRLFVETTASGTADAAYAACWARSFLRLVHGLVRAPNRALSAAPLLSPEERDRVVHRLNAHTRDGPQHARLTAPFEEQARITPEAVALVAADGTTVSYLELDQQANRLAHHLARLGIRSGDRVGVCTERGTTQVVAIYAAAKAGTTSVPLDTDLPDDRIVTLLDDARPEIVLVDPAGRTRIPDGTGTVLDATADQAWADRPATRPVAAAQPDGIAHILYTSGTAGRPNGVAYPVAGVLAHLEWMQRSYSYGPGDTALCTTSPGAGVHIRELFWPLSHGARLVLTEPGRHTDPAHLAELVAAHRVTTVFLPPTVLTPFLERIDPARSGALRRALCGGEAVPPRLRDTFHRRLPWAELVNSYGPTETGSVVDMVLPREPGAPVPLGRPAVNVRLTLLDGDLEPVPTGMPAEAYIGGRTGLALAYWDAPAHTAERFVADPYGPPGSRLYRTGDLCRYRDDGVLEHLGRTDRPVQTDPRARR